MRKSEILMQVELLEHAHRFSREMKQQLGSGEAICPICIEQLPREVGAPRCD